MTLSPDPVAAFFDAHDQSQPIRLPTSGTSALPRAVLRTTQSWVASFPHVSELLEVTADSRVWVPGPLVATMNLFAVVHAAWVGALVVTRWEDATHAHLTPPALDRLLGAGRDVRELRLVVAGDRLGTALRQRATQAGAAVSSYYGAAELSFVAWGDAEDSLRPFPEVEVEARSGVLWVRSPYLCLGYDGEPGDLRRSEDGFVTVGDRGAVVDGIVRVTGREGVVVTGGATVRVADVEHLLRPGLRGEIVVVGMPHPDLGEVVAAVLTDPSDVSVARQRSRDLLAPAQQPRRWFHLAPLPLTPAGKTDRRRVPSLLAGLGEVARPDSAHDSAAEGVPRRLS